MILLQIFHIGDSFYNETESSMLSDLLVNFAGAFFGFGLSLLIYWHGNKRQREQDAKEQEVGKRALLKYFGVLIEKFIEVSEKNLALVKEFSDKQKVDLAALEILKRVPSHDFNRLLNVDNKGVFEAWIMAFPNGNPVVEYQLTNSAIDNIDGVVKEVQRMHEHVIEKSYDRLFEVKKMIDHVPDTLAAIQIELQNQLGVGSKTDPFYLAVDHLLRYYTKLAGQKSPMSEFVEGFIYETLVCFHYTFKHTHYSPEIRMICKKIRVQFNDVKNDIKHLISEYEKIDQNVKDSFTRLKNTAEAIKTFVK